MVLVLWMPRVLAFHIIHLGFNIFWELMQQLVSELESMTSRVTWLCNSHIALITKDTDNISILLQWYSWVDISAISVFWYDIHHLQNSESQWSDFYDNITHLYFHEILYDFLLSFTFFTFLYILFKSFISKSKVIYSFSSTYNLHQCGPIGGHWATSGLIPLTTRHLKWLVHWY